MYYGMFFSHRCCFLIKWPSKSLRKKRKSEKSGVEFLPTPHSASLIKRLPLTTPFNTHIPSHSTPQHVHKMNSSPSPLGLDGLFVPLSNSPPPPPPVAHSDTAPSSEQLRATHTIDLPAIGYNFSYVASHAGETNLWSELYELKSQGGRADLRCEFKHIYIHKY